VYVKFFKATVKGVFLSFLCSSSVMAAEEESHWWDNFSITPGAGFRYLGVDVYENLIVIMEIFQMLDLPSLYFL